MSVPLSVSLTYRGGRNNIRVWYHSLGPSPPVTCVFMCLCRWQGGQWWTLGVWRPLDGAPLLHSIILSIRVSGQWAAAHCVPAVRWGAVGMGFMSTRLSGETFLFSAHHININSECCIVLFLSGRFISLVLKVLKNSLLADLSLRTLWAFHECSMWLLFS